MTAALRPHFFAGDRVKLPTRRCPAILRILATLALAAPGFAQVETDAESLSITPARIRHLERSGASLLVLAESDQDVDQGRNYLAQAFAHGSAFAAQQLAYAHAVGNYLPLNTELSEQYYEIAVSQDDSSALLEYGLLLYSGHRLHKDAERGVSLIVRAAQLGNYPARAFLIEQLQSSSSLSDRVAADAWIGSMEEWQYAYGKMMISANLETGVLLPLDLQAAARWQEQLERPAAAQALLDLASAYANTGLVFCDLQMAKRLLQRSIAFGNDHAINNYAWILATSRRADIRDGAKAVDLMLALLARRERTSSRVDTLAAAYAESGNFSAAVAAQQEAIELFVDEGDQELERARQRQIFYQEGRPWRE